MDELGLAFPNTNNIITGVNFLHSAVYSNEFPDVKIADGFGIAQHHGIATRLLDWTRRPLVAAYFASQVPDRPHSIEHVAVWAIDISFVRKMDDSFGVKIITSERAQDPYLRAQDGLFITCERASQTRIRLGSWPSLPDILGLAFSSGEKPVRVIRLPVDQVNDLERLLLRERISLAHLMPSYDNAARLVISQWAKNAGMRIEVTAY